jgi:hypothetical protein
MFEDQRAQLVDLRCEPYVAGVELVDLALQAAQMRAGVVKALREPGRPRQLRLGLGRVGIV